MSAISNNTKCFNIYVDSKSIEFCSGIQNRLLMLEQIMKLSPNFKMLSTLHEENMMMGNFRCLLASCLDRNETDCIFLVSQGVKVKAAVQNQFEKNLDWVNLCKEAKLRNTRFHFICNLPLSEDRSFLVFAAQMTGGYCLYWELENQHIEQMIFKIIMGMSQTCTRFINMSSFDFTKCDESNTGFLPCLNQQNRTINRISKLNSGLGMIASQNAPQRRMYVVTQKMRLSDFEISEMREIILHQTFDPLNYDINTLKSFETTLNDNMLNERWWNLFQMHPFSLPMCKELKKRKMFFQNSNKIGILLNNQSMPWTNLVKTVWFHRGQPKNWNNGITCNRFIVNSTSIHTDIFSVFKAIRQKSFDLTLLISKIKIVEGNFGIPCDEDCETIFSYLFSLFINDFVIVSNELKTNIALISLTMKNCALYQKAQEFFILRPPYSKSLSRKLCTFIIESKIFYGCDLLYRKRLVRKGLYKNRNVIINLDHESVRISELIQTNGMENLVNVLLNIPMKRPKLIKFNKYEIPSTPQKTLLSLLKEIVESGQYYKQSCHMCFSDKRWDIVIKPCTETNCSAVACKDCQRKWYNSNQPGKIWNSQRIKCPFCKKAPGFDFINQYNDKITSVKMLEGDEDEHMYYAWCKRCQKIAEYCPKQCAQQEIPNPERFACADCKKTGARPCPRCGHGIIKIDGCNHIRCVCGGHWCYQCGKEFSENTIYQHMTNEHGGYFTRDDVTDEIFD